MKKLLLVLVFLLTSCNSFYPSPQIIDQPPETLPVFPAVIESNSTAILEQERLGLKSQELLVEIDQLSSERQADLVLQPGWLYLRARISGANPSLFSEWGMQLPEYEQEKWLALDQTGKVVRAVSRILDADQQVLQWSVFKAGKWHNLTLGAESVEPSNGTFDSNYGFYELASQLVQQGHQIHSDTIYHDCWYQGERYAISDGLMNYEAVFNPHRHSLRWIKTYRISDGSIVLVNSLELMIEKRIKEPPADIMAVLDQQ